MNYFFADGNGLAAHGQGARASEGDVTLVFDGLVYGLDGGEFPAGLSPKQIAERCLKHYLRGKRDFFSRVGGQCVMAIADGKKRHFFRSPLAAQQIYYTDEAASNRLAPVYHAAGKPAADPAYFWELMSERESIHYDSPRTPFQTIHRLAPGHSLTIGRDGAETKQLAPPTRFPYPSNPGQTAAEVGARVRALIEDAVEARLPEPGKPVVCHLSGGLDSSFISALVARKRPDMTAFMYSFPDRPSHAFSLECAKTVAAECGIALTVVEPRQIPKTELGEPLPYCDEPSNAFWQGALFAPITDRLVPKDATLFTGFGADQIFQRDERVLPWLLKRGELRPVLRILTDAAKGLDRSRAHLIWQTLLLSLPRPVYRRLAEPFSTWRFNPFALEEMDEDAVLLEKVDWLPMPGHDALAAMIGAGAPPTTAGYAKLEFSYLTAPHLSSDPFFEGRGAHAEHPYCDSRLIEYVMGGVSWELLHDWRSPYKHLLREAQKGIVPEPVRNREKNEFYFDGFLAKLLKDNQTVLRDLLGRADLPLDVGLDRNGMYRAFDQLMFGSMSNSASKLLVLISYLIWWRDFQKVSPPSPPKPH